MTTVTDLSRIEEIQAVILEIFLDHEMVKGAAR
jgi:hypothetical protein